MIYRQIALFVVLFLVCPSCTCNDATKLVSDVGDDDTRDVTDASDVRDEHDTTEPAKRDVSDTFDGSRDADVSGDGDVSGDADAGPLPWFEDRPQRCGSTDVVIPAEQWKPAELPEPLGETPRLVWSAEPTCVDGGTFDSSYAMARLTVGGEKRDVVVASIQRHTPEALSDELAAIAFVDAGDGQLLGCHRFDRPLLQTTPTIFVSSDLERYWLYTETMRDEVEPQVEPPVKLLHSASLDGEHFTREIFRPDSGAIRPNLLTANGQWLAGFEGSQLVSFDAVTGEPLWGRRASELSRDGEVPTFGWAFNGPNGSVYVVLRYGLSSSRSFRVMEIDECGDTSEVLAGRGHASVARPQGGHWILSLRRDGRRLIVIYRDDGVELYSEECLGGLVYREGRFACFARDGVDASISAFSFDGSERRVTELPSLDAYHRGRYNFGSFVTGEGTVLIQRSATTSPEPGTGETVWLEIDPDSQEIVETFPAPEPEHNPMLSASGMLVLYANGTIHGYQTHLNGLGPVPRPRGGTRGGNENRGYVEVPAAD